MPWNLKGLARKRVVVLPDFFLDAIVRLPPWDEARPDMEQILSRGGGNLPVGPVRLKVGGNAANTAFALARLGARVELIAETDPVGLALLQEARHASGLGLGHVRVSDTSPTTLALEFDHANLMLSHRGPLDTFGPRRLSPRDWRLIESADAVAVTNWAQNRRGTDLLRAVAGRARRAGAFVFVDTGDPRHRGGDAQALLADARVWRNVDAWGLNENEVRAFSGREDGPLEALARDLAHRLGCRIDLHSRAWAYSVAEDGGVKVAAEAAPAQRLTGAGDAWNAGNLAGYLLGWAPAERLGLAHRTASAYLTGKDGLPPSARDLARPNRRSSRPRPAARARSRST